MKIKKIKFDGRIDKADVIGYIGAQPVFCIALAGLNKALQPAGIVGKAAVFMGAATAECIAEQGIKKVVRKVEEKRTGKTIRDDSEDYVVVEFA